jgi:hypothetical protein
MTKKYAVIANGVIYGYYEKMEDAKEFIDNQTQVADPAFPLTQGSFKIVKIEKVYKLTKVDENQDEILYGFKETQNDDDTDYDTMFDELNVYGDGYDW